MKAHALAAVGLALGLVAIGCGGKRSGAERAGFAARATTSATIGPAPLEVRFRDASAGAGSVRWEWDFGDGTPAARVMDPVHVFTTPGRYSVTLSATDVLGRTDVATVATITVMVAAPPPAPTPPANPNSGSPFWYEGNTFGTPLKTHTTEEAAAAQAIFVAINSERARAGVRLLTIDAALTRAAKAHAEDMTGRGYFDHLTPEGWTPEVRLQLTGGAAGIVAVGENIYGGPVAASTVLATWMASPGHRANVLSTSYTHVGVGLDAPNVVALFAVR